MEKGLKYDWNWRARFSDGVTICQDPLDLYSKYDPEAEYNPSSFRDFQDYYDEHKSELETFELWGLGMFYVVRFVDDGKPEIRKITTSPKWSDEVISKEEEELTDIRPIYYRNMETTIVDGVFGEPKVRAFCIGYQGLDKNGNSRKKIITVI